MNCRFYSEIRQMWLQFGGLYWHLLVIISLNNWRCLEIDTPREQFFQYF